MKVSHFLVASAGVALAACQPSSGQETAAVSAQPMHSEGHALAQAACAGCHSIEPVGLSPNPQAPEWPVIANTRGLTRETLTNWLVEAHNYPEQMDFYLEDDEVEQLVDYMLTLQSDDYHPPY
ncbi:c-type cytochrome [Aurantiacibacter sp. MUD61]|uniref:c-type cytochrome n=1 Tax=Aurantiacibacter sp. MUD61 TaxID=3009083 RepID=UPI0022F0B879|nr:cytochrome c [Aurantiacibacter sp. MUD61]